MTCKYNTAIVRKQLFSTCNYSSTITGPVVICPGDIPTYSATNWIPGNYWNKSSNLSLSNAYTNPTTVTGAGVNEIAWVSVNSSSGVELKRYYIWLGGLAIVYNSSFPPSLKSDQIKHAIF